MSDLGKAILLAMRDQGWMITTVDAVMRCASPEGGPAVFLPVTLIHEEDEHRMRVILLSLIVVYGLVWPWPPDLYPDVHGETPIAE